MLSRNCAVLAVALGLALMPVYVGATALNPTKANPSGPMTRSGNKTWQIISFPLRLMTGAAGLAFGAIGGGMKGIVHTEEAFATQTFGEADKNPLMVPVGLIGTLAALPVGIATGVPVGAAEGSDLGFRLWDQF
ncbi:hypothetical protein [Vampirovibrio sp.]|uniref:hypothetical protein n=1 Tax=Vampirovibrio sp. TaxID=2717857 RepID=UPI0035940F7C